MAAFQTPYAAYSNGALHALFHSENWNRLSFSDKLSACQEVENRYAAEKGVPPCQVTHEFMEGGSFGWQSGGKICLNTHLLLSGEFVTHFTDADGNVQESRVKMEAVGWNLLDTVYHEGTHGVQDAQGRIPDTYIQPSMDHALYRIQGIEKEAYAVGQSRALDALKQTEQLLGKQDPERQGLINMIQSDSFQAALQDAARHYNDPNIEQTLEQVIADRQNGVLRENASPSYGAIAAMCDRVYGPVIVQQTAQEETASPQAVLPAQAETVQTQPGADVSQTTAAQPETAQTQPAEAGALQSAAPSQGASLGDGFSAGESYASADFAPAVQDQGASFSDGFSAGETYEGGASSDAGRAQDADDGYSGGADAQAHGAGADTGQSAGASAGSAQSMD